MTECGEDVYRKSGRDGIFGVHNEAGAVKLPRAL